MVKRLALALVVVAIGVLACMPQDQCNPTYTEYCAVNGNSIVNCTGQLVDANTWQSGPILGTWLDFAHATDMHMHLRDGLTGAELLGEIVNIQGYVSPQQRPNDPVGGNQFAPCAGNLCELHVYPDGPDGGATGGWVIDVINDSCADYFAYVVVTTAPVGSSADASTEASTDAATE